MGSLILLLTYSILHAAVDAGSVFATVRIIHFVPQPSEALYFSLVMTYDLLAFSSQIFLGYFLDKIRLLKWVVVTSCLLIILAVFLSAHITWGAVALAGIGNALFHLSSAGILFRQKVRVASVAGILIGPGAIGLALGIKLGQNQPLVYWPYALLLLLFCYIVLRLKEPQTYQQPQKLKLEGRYLKLALGLILVNIFIRALIGYSIVLPWKTNLPWFIFLTLGVAGGKCLGGVWSDYFGWIRVSVGALIISAPLIFLGKTIPILGIVGMFLFQVTTGVTLGAVILMFPSRPCFALGITCLALIFGCLPIFISHGLRLFFQNQWVVFACIMASALALYAGLRLFRRESAKLKINYALRI